MASEVNDTEQNVQSETSPVDLVSSVDLQGEGATTTLSIVANDPNGHSNSVGAQNIQEADSVLCTKVAELVDTNTSAPETRTEPTTSVGDPATKLDEAQPLDQPIPDSKEHNSEMPRVNFQEMKKAGSPPKPAKTDVPATEDKSSSGKATEASADKLSPSAVEVTKVEDSKPSNAANVISGGIDNTADTPAQNDIDSSTEPPSKSEQDSKIDVATVSKPESFGTVPSPAPIDDLSTRGASAISPSAASPISPSDDRLSRRDEFISARKTKNAHQLVESQHVLLKNLHGMKDDLDAIDREIQRMLKAERMAARERQLHHMSTFDDDELPSYREPGRVFRSRFLHRHRSENDDVGLSDAISKAASSYRRRQAESETEFTTTSPTTELKSPEFATAQAAEFSV